MCFSGREVMCFPGRGTHVSSDTCLPGRDM